MSAPLPPLHALSIVHPTPRLRMRAAPSVPLIGRLWAWLMEPIDHGGQPDSRAQLLARARRQGLQTRVAGTPR